METNMDPFTQQMLERAKARRKVLNSRMAGLSAAADPAGCKKRTLFQEDTAVPTRDDTKYSPPKRHCFEDDDDDKENESKPVESDGIYWSASRKKLGPLDGVVEETPEPKRDWKARKARLDALANKINEREDDATIDIPACTEATPPPPPPIPSPEKKAAHSEGPVAQTQSTKVSNLVAQLEEKVGRSRSPSPGVKPQPTGPPQQKSMWDQELLNALVSSGNKSGGGGGPGAGHTSRQAQGFQPTPSTSRLVYHYTQSSPTRHRSPSPASRRPYRSPSPASRPTQAPPSPVPAPPSPRVVAALKKPPQSGRQEERRKQMGSKVAERAAMFERNPGAQVNQAAMGKDPSKMSVTERAAMFEKKGGDPPPMPIASLSSPLTPQMLQRGTAERGSFRSGANPTVVHKMAERSVSSSIVSSYAESTMSMSSEASSMLSSSGVSTLPSNIGRGTFEAQRQLMEQMQRSWKDNDIARQVQEQRSKEMAVLMNRWSQDKADKAAAPPPEQQKQACPTPQRPAQFCPPPPPPLPPATMEEKVSPSKAVGDYPGLKEERPIRVSPPKPGKLYPCLSDMEPSSPDSSESDDDCEEASPDKSMNSSFGFGNSVLQAVGVSVPGPSRLSPQKMSEAAVSAAIDEILDASDSDEEEEMRFKSPTIAQDEPVDETLLHSVSVYRKQNAADATPVRRIIRNPDVNMDEAANSPQVPLHQQIRALQDEVASQQRVIGQASQALNVCHARPEFVGSTEHVEAERLLLLASLRRTAALDEIRRLKTDGGIGEETVDMATSGRGSLSFSGVSVPLRRDFLARLASGGDGAAHHFIATVRYRGTVVATQLGTTTREGGLQNGSIVFPNLMQLRGIESGFTAILEIHSLETAVPSLKNKRTPKKTKLVQSPAGPTAVRTPQFKCMGSLTVTLRALHAARNQGRVWSLQRVPAGSPLDGRVSVTVQCHADDNMGALQRGFLTLFQEVGGLGSWNRRWACLSADRLEMWTYPDDERERDPIVSVDLHRCVTSKVGLVARDICARQNTIVLDTARHMRDGDVETLVVSCHGGWTRQRYLLSADTKEERLVWSQQLNRALANLRAWDPDATRPDSM